MYSMIAWAVRFLPISSPTPRKPASRLAPNSGNARQFFQSTPTKCHAHLLTVIFISGMVEAVASGSKCSAQNEGRSINAQTAERHIYSGLLSVRISARPGRSIAILPSGKFCLCRLRQYCGSAGRSGWYVELFYRRRQNRPTKCDNAQSKKTRNALFWGKILL